MSKILASISPKAVHDLTKHTLTTEAGQNLFAKKLLACCLDNEACFKLVTVCVNYDVTKEAYTRNDFRDPLDSLVMGAMQEFHKTWLSGNPWPINRQQWARSIMPHLGMFFGKNPSYPEALLQAAIAHLLSLPPIGPGDLDLIYDGLVDYVTGHRYFLLEAQLGKLDPGAKKELLESTPRSIRVPGAAVEMTDSVNYLDAIFGSAAVTVPFHTGVHAFDKNYASKAQPGDAWLGFANPGGGKTNWACQIAGNTVDRGKKVLLVTTEVVAPTLLMRCFCAAKFQSYAALTALRSKSPMGNTLGEMFVAWVQGPGKNLHIVDYRSVAGSNFREKVERIMDAYYRKMGCFPDLEILDWIGGSLDSSFSDSWQKREAYEQTAVRWSRLADELGNVSVCLAQAKKECKNKTNLSDQDTADCSSLSQSMEGVIGLTSLMETGGEELNGEVKEVHRTRQYWIVCKCRETESLKIPVDRKFSEMRFANAD